MINIVTESQKQEIKEYLLNRYDYNSLVEFAELFPDERVSLEKINDTYTLIMSCTNGDISVLKLLAKNNFNFSTTEHSCIALTQACLNEQFETVKFLVEHGANIRVDKDTPLKISCSIGHLEMVKYLVEHGANVNVSNSKPLKNAMRYKNVEVVKYLIKKGARIQKKIIREFLTKNNSASYKI